MRDFAPVAGRRDGITAFDAAFFAIAAFFGAPASTTFLVPVDTLPVDAFLVATFLVSVFLVALFLVAVFFVALFLGAVFRAADFLVADFLAAGFFVAVLLATAFLVAAFLATPDFFATTPLAAAFLAVAFLAVALSGFFAASLHVAAPAPDLAAVFFAGALRAGLDALLDVADLPPAGVRLLRVAISASSDLDADHRGMPRIHAR